MTTDLTMLAAAVALAIVLAMLYTTARILGGNLLWAAGNRDTPVEDLPWVARAERAHRNLVENLPLFASVVLIVHVVGAANETTALGATVFVGARVAHAVVYVVGLTWVRTACWMASVAGMAVMASQLL